MWKYWMIEIKFEDKLCDTVKTRPVVAKMATFYVARRLWKEFAGSAVWYLKVVAKCEKTKRIAGDQSVAFTCVSR